METLFSAKPQKKTRSAQLIDGQIAYKDQDLQLTIAYDSVFAVGKGPNRRHPFSRDEQSKIEII